MRFGDHIRELRRARGWTQPEAAGLVGIEQSYLSKLEAGKSYPSEDVFSSLVNVYKLDPADMTDKLFPAELDRLREISQVRESLLRQRRDDEATAKRWLIGGVGLLMVGGASLGLVLLGSDKIVETYQYKSGGFVAETETVSDLNGSDDERILPEDAIEYRSLDEYRDVVFFEPVANGRRVWRFYGARSETKQSPLRWFLVPSLMAMFGAFGCFFASYRSR